MNKLSFGKKLQKIRKHFGITITTMSDTIGVVKSNISRYERDLNKPSIDFVEKMLKYYNVNLNWLFGQGTQMFNATAEGITLTQVSKKKVKITAAPLEKIVELPLVSYTSFGIPIFTDESHKIHPEQHLLPVSGDISAGAPMEIKESEPYDFVPFPFYKSGKDLEDYLVFRVNGLSMAPEIDHEDIVFVKRNTNWFDLNGKIVAVMIQGEMTLKKLYLNDSQQEVIFKPLNKDFSDIHISYEMMEATFLVGELKAIRRVFHRDK